jgi:hypothetical protein
MAKPKTPKTDEELLKHLAEKAPEVLEARIDFHAIAREIVRTDADRIGGTPKRKKKNLRR